MSQEQPVYIQTVNYHGKLELRAKENFAEQVDDTL